MESNKKKYGQFFTTNYEYILSGMTIPSTIKNIVEPFAGGKDLLSFIKNKEKYKIEMYDIEPKYDDIIKRDTLLNPVDLNNKFAITNPPYLARNKSNNKEIFDKYNMNDLYKCYISQLISSENHTGGIIIIPLNFFCSIRKNDILLRKNFLAKYKIVKLNIFEERVFEDTSYTVSSFQYEKKTGTVDSEVNMIIYKNGKILKSLSIELNKKNNFTIGGEVYQLPYSEKYSITRLTSDNKKDTLQITNLLVKCIDDNLNSKINLSIVEDKDIYIDDTPNSSARTYATLIVKPSINKDKQKKLAESFNNYLNQLRDKYNSLFLTNYRESKDIARKRISFDLVYQIVGYLLDKMDKDEINKQTNDTPPKKLLEGKSKKKKNKVKEIEV
jgi:hypothetical protein